MSYAIKLLSIISDPGDKFLTFNFNELFLRLPLCLICLLAVPKNCNQELYDVLMDENLRWASVENLITYKPSIIAFILNAHKKLGLGKLICLTESLLNMGLITRLDHPGKPIRFKTQVGDAFPFSVFMIQNSDRLPSF